MSRLEETFLQLCRPFTGDETKINALWQKITAAYTWNDRHYHTLQHLEYLLDQLDYCGAEISDRSAVLFALYYHDIVYDTLSSDNEAKSAVAARKAMESLSVAESIIDKTTAIILATQHHEASEDHDTNLLTDADLSILGADEAHYEQYRKQVRSEYSMYPDAIYGPGRRKVLEHFLGMEHIYKTDLFAARYETPARYNLQQELDQLK